ncbi:HNH/ENDO VII family nuclease [Desulfovibrio sp. ZJ200]|uniref:HNH/ENDO VII family nuclease n=1 Tax=Desulfovibrio sp. ZJ200 TaxID=2709792 RepID=UPI0013E9C1FE|nr:HNH/ENDO VII family nuclease [Desulfovibrio sp. ZJ200]
MKIITTTIYLLFLFSNFAIAETHNFSIIDDGNNKKYLILDDELYEVSEDGSLYQIDYSEYNNDIEFDSGFSASVGALVGPMVRLVPYVISRAKYLWRVLSKTKFVQKIRKIFFPRKISEFEKRIIKNSKVITYNGKTVSQRNHIIDKSKKCGGVTSCDALGNGKPPFSKSCSPIQLHHILQEDDGHILELTQEEHTQNYSELHKHTNISEINRPEFDKWRRDYWKERSRQLCF